MSILQQLQKALGAQSNQGRSLSDITKVIKGMAMDTSFTNQPQGTYRSAMNMSLESNDGDASSLVNEEGSIAFSSLEPEEVIVGVIPVNDGRVILFIYGEDDGVPYSKISQLNESDGSVDLIIKTTTCLNFLPTKLITGIYKIKLGCELIVYFTDNHNTFKTINLSSLGQYTNRVGVTPEDWVNYANNNDDWICNSFNFSRNVTFPQLSDPEMLNGGSMEIGTYYVYIRYLTEDLSPSNIVAYSKPIHISDSVERNDFAEPNYYHGGSSSPDNPNNSGKGIRIEITNLDTTQSFFEVILLKFTNDGDSVPNDIITLQPYEVDNDTKRFTYYGTEDTTSSLTLDDVLIPNLIVNKIKTLEQVDNRLFLGNITNLEIDHTALQRHSSKIKLKWAAREFEHNKYTSEYISNNHIGFKRDEIYAFGIVYVFTDGTESPVYHIPGRAKDAITPTSDFFNSSSDRAVGTLRNIVTDYTKFDSQLIQVVAEGTLGEDADTLNRVEIQNVSHIPLDLFVDLNGDPVSDKLDNYIERWRLFNTSTFLTLNAQLVGDTAYYEGRETYPIIYGCDGQSVWGTDAWGNELAGTFIRHHRMPDENLIPSVGKSLLGTSFSNPLIEEENDTNYITGNITKDFVKRTIHVWPDPATLSLPTGFEDRIVGFKIVRAEKNTEDYTVIDSGRISPSRPNTTGSTINYFFNSLDLCEHQEYTVDAAINKKTRENVLFVSPESMIRKDVNYKSTYLKFEAYEERNLAFHMVRRSRFTPGLPPGKHEMSYNSLYRNISEFSYVSNNSLQPRFGNFDADLSNNLVNLDLTFLKIEGDWHFYYSPNLVETPKAYRVTIKRWTDPHDNIFQTVYTNTHGSVVLFSDFDALPDTSINPTMYCQGDVFVGNLDYWALNNNISNRKPSESIGLNAGDPTYATLLLGEIYESRLNSELRKIGDNEWETYFTSSTLTQLEFLDLDQFHEDDDSNWAQNYLVENRDHALAYGLNKYYPLSRSFKYCSNCEESFPTRVMYSEKDSQESTIDKYKTLRANNYYDLSLTAGDVTRLFVFKDNLFCNSERGSFAINSRPQQIQTNDGVLNVGIGDIFSVPPQMLETTNRGYGGSQHMMTNVVTEFGTFFADADAGKVFLFDGKLNDVSASLMRRWFNNNLPFTEGVESQIEGFDNFDPINSGGIGLSATLDPNANRIILHKKHYRIIDEDFLNTLEVTEGYVENTTNGYNSLTGIYYSYPLGGFVNKKIRNNDIMQNTSIIEDLSWTISLSLPYKAWVSFHSYKPYFMFHTRNSMYNYNYNFPLTDSDTIIHKFTDDIYCSYFDGPKPCYVHAVFKDKDYYPKVYNSVNLHLKAYSKEEKDSFVTSNRDFIKNDSACFTAGFFHTDTQTSGYLSFISKKESHESDPFREVNDNKEQIGISNNEGVWSINEFKDYTIDYTVPVLTDNWANAGFKNAKTFFNYPYFINENSYSFDKNPFEVGQLRGPWLGAFLIKSDITQNDYTPPKIVLDYINSSFNLSFK